MDIINLPYDLFPAEKDSGHVLIHDYTAPENALKGKSILHTNSISLVISGEKTMHFAEKTIKISSDEFHFLSAGNCLASMNLSKNIKFRSILLFFDNKTLTDFYLKYDSLVKKQKAKRSIAAASYVSIRKDDFVRQYIASLSLMTGTGKAISPAMRLLKFEELMLHLLENYPAEVLSFQPPGENDKDDLEIRKAVETNITNTISLEELAFLCNISLSTFKRRFAKLYGTTPNKWFLQKRMEKAKELLQHYREKPGEVFHKVGYENHSSFTQSFKQMYGVAPKDFQQQKMNVKQ
jgi:AraC-like DNA-binding protein